MEQISEFNSLLLQLENGGLHTELNGRMKELIAYMLTHGAESGSKLKGSIALKIEFTLEKERFAVKPEVTVRVPKIMTPNLPRPATMLYATADNALSRTDPKQRELPLPPA